MKDKRIRKGLKLYSTNLEAIPAAERLFQENFFDYIELMAIPGTYHNTIPEWRQLKIPINLHAPHSQYGFNLSDSSQRSQNALLYDEVRKFAESLSAKIIIVHPGLTGTINETIFQVNSFDDKRIAIENMPFISLMGTRCIGSRPKEIAQIVNATGCGFCFDIVHAVKSAFSYGRDAFEFIENFMILKPKIIHLCGLEQQGYFDEHRNLCDGDFDLNRLFQFLFSKDEELTVTLEIPEEDYSLLTSFQNDIYFLGTLRFNFDSQPVL